MKIAVCQLKSVSPFSPSKYYKVPKLSGELAAAYEERTWRERCHVDSKGMLLIPPMMFANSIKVAAKYLSRQIPGKGKSTFTKHFESGVMVMQGLTLPIHKNDVDGEWCFVPSDGIRGSGSRVEKCFPVVPEWSGSVEYLVVDPIITEDVFSDTLEVCGSLIGIGRFRPKNLGFYGRFEVESINWSINK